MSGVDLSEFRSAYLVEAEELIAASTRHLLALEMTTARGDLDVRTVRELFRAVHTIKGLSAMVGVEPIVAISHRMESALRRADRQGGKLSAASIDAMLEGIRAISERVRSIAGNHEPSPAPAPLLDRLGDLEIQAAAPVAPPAMVSLDPELDGKLRPSDREQLTQGMAAGRRALVLEFSPSTSQEQSGVTITTVREGLASVADIVRVFPRSMPVTPATPGGLIFAILLTTSVDDEALAQAAGLTAPLLRTLGGGAPQAPAVVEVLDEDEPIALHHGVVRVDVARLDDAMEGLSAIIVNRFRLTQAMHKLAETGADVRELGEALKDGARHLRALRTAILRVRMVPLAEVLDRVPLLVRGISRTLGKTVRLSLDVGDAALDKSVADRIFPALVHLVRNAVDHAIEAPEERRSRGKPEEGRLSITSMQRADTQIEIVCEDDGRGIDAAEVARRARKDVPDDDAELLELLCLPGLSTRDEATTTSGRGMGMDIVRRIVVDELGGELRLETRPGEGTRFILRVPMTISIVDAFTFEAAGERFCVPISTIEEIVDVDHARLVHAPPEGSGSAHLGMLERRGEALPFLALSRVLRRVGGAARKAFVVRRNGESLAFAVDKLLGQQAILVRPLEDPLVRVAGVTGATDLGDGRPTLVLDLYALAGGVA